MIKDILNKDTILEKAKFLSGKKFKPGYDGMSMDGAYSWIYINGERLCNDIINGDYRPMPAMGFRSAKMQGGFRKLSRLTAIDTILQTVLNDALAQKVESLFSDNSFAFRSGRGVHTALERYVDFSKGK